MNPLPHSLRFTVSIIGTNLFGHGDSVTMVTFGGIQAEIDSTSSSNTQVQVRIGENDIDTNTPVSITITSNTLATVESDSDIWTYLVPGNIDDVTPATGQNRTRVTIAGKDYIILYI